MSRTPEAHLAAVRALVAELPAESVSPLAAAARGARLADEVRAQRDAPAFDNSQMDGYAVPRRDAASWQVGPTVAAGVDPDALYPMGLGQVAAPVMTGSKLPRGTAAVVPVEACEPSEFLAEGAQIRVPASEAGSFIRRAGSDIRAGSVLAPAGAPVTPALVGALAAQGVAEVAVRRAARVLLITGGREVGGEGATAIPDSNGPMLEALCARHGIEVAARLRTDDDPQSLEVAVRRSVEQHQADAIVTSGGISHGKFEVIRQVFQHGWYGHVGQQPGGPQGLSTFAGVPVISLPGNPISTLASFRLYVAPVLGHAPAPIQVPLGAPLLGLDDREQFVRGLCDRAGVTPLPGTSSHLLSQAVSADCLIRVPAGSHLQAGELALVYPL